MNGNTVQTDFLVYEASLSYLQGACNAGVLRTTVDDCIASMVTDSVVSAIVESLECRKRVLEISNRLELTNDPNFFTAMREDEERIAAFLVDIFSSKTEEKTVLRLEGDSAQHFLDVVQETLDRGFLMTQEYTQMAFRMIRKLSESCDRLPSSLFIVGVNNRDEYPVFGGGFGDIYRASYGEQRVALKRMRYFVHGSDLRRMHLKFCREALIWKELRHPNILPFVGIDRDSFPSFLCMISHWMYHGTVMHYLKTYGHANVDKLLHQIAQGLEYLHSHNIVHGDLRGANILIQEDGSACLADFGLSTFVDATATMSTTRAGSLYWMAPELLRPERFGLKFARTPATDVYAFGCVCFELYTGRPPFSAWPEPVALMKVLDGERPERPSGPPAMSDILWKHIMEFLAESPYTRPSTQVVVQNMGPSRKNDAIFALVIGINDYIAKDQLPPLRGAVNDAKTFREYLLNKLYVRDSNILFMENEQATRANIMFAFQSHFLENQSIPDHGETTMIFFFSGHGTRVQAPANIKTGDNMVEAISPVDERTTNDAGEEYVHAIPNYVLGRLLWEISEKKGRNITVIIDASHSSGMGCDIGQSEYISVSTSWPSEGCKMLPHTTVSPSRPIPQDLDSYLWNGRKTAMPFRKWSASESHVLLAACRETETVRECQYRKGYYRGRFTATLISLLEYAPLEITYEQLMNRMPKWSSQTPQCRGSGINRLVFNGKYSKTGHLPISLAWVNPEDKSSKFFRVNNMGTLQGVVPGTEFSVYDVKDKFLCTLVAHSVQMTHSILVGDKLPTPITPWSRVVVSDAPILRVHIVACRGPHPPKFVQAPTLDDALAVRIERGRGQDPEQVVVESRTPTMLKIQNEARFPLPADPAKLLDALDGVARFNYFLERANDVDTLQGFSLEVHRLKGRGYRRKLDESIGNMVKDDVVHFKSVAGAEYGFIIRNTGPEGLYPHLFYFDPETFTIQQWYAPPTRFGRPPLQVDWPITVGMGHENAFEFMLEPDQKSSSGFVKLFVTREFVDLSWINQRISPFDPKFVRSGRPDTQAGPFDKMATWDALTVTLTITQ